MDAYIDVSATSTTCGPSGCGTLHVELSYCIHACYLCVTVMYHITCGHVYNTLYKGLTFRPRPYNHSHSGNAAVAAEFFGHASHKTLWLVEYLCPMNTFLFLQCTTMSSELSGMFNNSSEIF